MKSKHWKEILKPKMLQTHIVVERLNILRRILLFYQKEELYLAWNLCLFFLFKIEHNIFGCFFIT